MKQFLLGFILLTVFASIYKPVESQLVPRGYEKDVPVGLLGKFAGPNCPTGWTRTDGRSVLRTAMPNLFAYTGFAHGNGTVNSTGTTAMSGCPHATNCFNLPDTRGLFDRDMDSGAGRDPDAATRTAALAGGNAGLLVGSVQSYQIQSHLHRLLVSSGSGDTNNAPSYPSVGVTGESTGSHAYNNTALIEAFGGGETRGKNIAFLTCIKF